MRKVLNSAEQTFDFGYNLASALCGGEIILLVGEMGCGKTVFTKGLAAGLGIKREILSPTFALMNEYSDGRLKLYHIDAYRLTDIVQVEEAGLTEYFGVPDSVCVIEWPEILIPLIEKQKYFLYTFKYIDESTREVVYDK